MRFNYDEINYVTVIKQFYPEIAITGYSDPNVYDSITFSLNGKVKPTKSELDILINQISISTFIENIGQAIKTSFFKIGQKSGTSIIPFDNSVPSISEGTQIASITVSPVSNYSKFNFDGNFFVDSSVSNRNIVISLFRDSVCIYSMIANVSTSGRGENIAFECFDEPKTISPVVYSIRAGVNTNATWYLNQNAGGVSNGGTIATYLRISEYS